jgi:hypothetical protein
MLVLTDEVIERGIDNISAYIVAKVAEDIGMPIEDVQEKYLSSKAYALLSDKNTGYYWDSIPELLKMFTAELDAFTE